LALRAGAQQLPPPAPRLTARAAPLPPSRAPRADSVTVLLDGGGLASPQALEALLRRRPIVRAAWLYDSLAAGRLLTAPAEIARYLAQVGVGAQEWT
jgi:hypothetical protein